MVLTEKVPKKSKLHLSKRESECLHYLVQGKTAKQTAQILSISHRTVETYIENLKLKLKCKNKAELMVKALS
jgi:DNA-binding CsgD family transcriptional regulator